MYTANDCRRKLRKTKNSTHVQYHQMAKNIRQTENWSIGRTHSRHKEQFATEKKSCVETTKALQWN
jgi:uncharacterized protein YqcC (DUF446 family)